MYFYFKQSNVNNFFLLQTPCETNDDVIDVPNTDKLITQLGGTSENIQENV